MPTTILRYVKTGLPVVLVLLCLPVPEPALAQAADDEWLRDCRSRDVQRERHCEVRDLTLGPTRHLRVDGGENGGVAVRAHEGDGVRARARIQARARSGSRAEAIAREVRIVTAAGELRAEGPRTARDESWSVVFYLVVPREIDLELRAKNGPVSVRGVSGRLEMGTVNGPMVADFPVTVTLRGRLSQRMTLTLGDGGTRVRVMTTNGPFNLRRPNR